MPPLPPIPTSTGSASETPIKHPTLTPHFIALHVTLSVLQLTTPPPPVPTGSNGVLQCRWCAYNAPTQRAIALHASTAHNYRSAAWFYASGTACTICLHQHLTRSRLVQHLMRPRTTCLTTLLHYYPPLLSTRSSPTPSMTPSTTLPCGKPCRDSMPPSACRHLTVR